MTRRTKEEEAAFQRVASAADAAVRKALFDVMTTTGGVGSVSTKAAVSGTVTALLHLAGASLPKNLTPIDVAGIVAELVMEIGQGQMRGGPGANDG